MPPTTPLLLLRSSARAATPQIQQRATRPLLSRRTYADERPRPPLPRGHAAMNQTIVLGFIVVAIPALAWFVMRPTRTKPSPARVSAPALDPAAAKREADANADATKQHKHPEDEDPELKAPFGRTHKPKRVDGPPDDRNHGSLSERNRQG